MPREITDIRDFLKKSRRKDAQYVKIKKVGNTTKFKLRLSKYLWTLKVSNTQKADKIKESFPPGLKKQRRADRSYLAPRRGAERPRQSQVCGTPRAGTPPAYSGFRCPCSSSR